MVPVPVNFAQLLASNLLPKLELQMICEHVLQVDRSWTLAHDLDVLPSIKVEEITSLIKQRQSGVPMAYLVGRREFMGLDFKVNSSVLIPRPDTETLVEKALQWVDEFAYTRVLDLGTGSGAIALALAHYAPVQVLAVDFSADALQVAQANAEHLKLGRDRVEFVHSDWFSQVLAQEFDLIVSNPPYIAADDEHLLQGDLRFEPSQALTDGDDGLQAYERILSQAKSYLSTKGAVLVEHGWQQSAQVQELFRRNGFNQVQSYPDLAGHLRITGGFR